MFYDRVYQAIFQSFVRGHEKVTIGVFHDLQSKLSQKSIEDATAHRLKWLIRELSEVTIQRRLVVLHFMHVSVHRSS